MNNTRSALRARSAGLALITTLIASGAATAQELPRAQDILKKSVAALGGADVIRKRSESHLAGTFDVPAAGISGTVEVFSATNPNRMFTLVDIPGVGTVRNGYDGTTAWLIHPAFGAQVLTGNQLEQTKQQADPMAMLDPDRYLASMETVERTTFDGKESYKVKLVTTWGETYHQYFDAKTHLPLGSVRAQESPMGAIEATTILEDYRSIDGLMVPHRMRQEMQGMAQVITIKSVAFKIPDPRVFDIPKEIEPLVKK